MSLSPQENGAKARLKFKKMLLNLFNNLNVSEEVRKEMYAALQDSYDLTLEEGFEDGIND